MPSGIPDFRSPGTGLWANVDPMEVAHISVWRRDPARFWGFYGQRFAPLRGQGAERRPPRAGRARAPRPLAAVITQNIDGLHARGRARATLIEIHGSVATASCLACDGARYPLAEDARAAGGGADGVPRCDCGDPLKPDVVLFGEMLDEAAMTRASDARHRRRPDARASARRWRSIRRPGCPS